MSATDVLLSRYLVELGTASSSHKAGRVGYYTITRVWLAQCFVDGYLGKGGIESEIFKSTVILYVCRL